MGLCRQSMHALRLWYKVQETLKTPLKAAKLPPCNSAANLSQTPSRCFFLVNTVTMVLCNTVYTLISIYLWGGFVSSQCFFPDGTLTEDVEDGYYPCNSTTGGQASACCQLTTSACTTEGYCIGNNGYAYRGACTDSSFPMPCPQYCLNGG